jgi:hypothetical protein
MKTRRQPKRRTTDVDLPGSASASSRGIVHQVMGCRGEDWPCTVGAGCCAPAGVAAGALGHRLGDLAGFGCRRGVGLDIGLAATALEHLQEVLGEG